MNNIRNQDLCVRILVATANLEVEVEIQKRALDRGFEHGNDEDDDVYHVLVGSLKDLETHIRELQLYLKRSLGHGEK